MAKRDWLGAIAEGVKGLPGGEVILGPLLKLRDDEKAEERNAAIDKMFVEQKMLNEQVLSTVLGLRDSLPEQRALVQVAAGKLEAQFRAERGQAVPILPVSKWPLPYTDGVLIQELESLFKNRDEIRDCLRRSDYQDIEEERISSFVIAFVDSITGNDRKKLTAVFECLSNKRPASTLLQFSATYLNSTNADAA